MKQLRKQIAKERLPGRVGGLRWRVVCVGEAVVRVPGLRGRLLSLAAVLGGSETGSTCEQLARPFLEDPESNILGLTGVASPAGEAEEVLAMIADLYGVDRRYLTDVGADPVWEEQITEQLHNDYFGYAVDRTHWFIPERPQAQINAITEQVEIVTRLGRRALYRETAVISVMHLLTTVLLSLVLTGIVVTPDLALVWKWVLGFCVGGGAVFAVGRGISDVRLQLAALRLGHDAFAAAYHESLRHQIAKNLAGYLRDTDLPYDFFYALFRHNVPVGYGTLDRLMGRRAEARKVLLRNAAIFEAPRITVRQSR